MRALLAVNNLGYIGLNGALPWRCSADLKHFKQLTLGQKLLVGHNTLKDMPPLKDRIVLTVERDFTDEDIKRLEFDWCIGGKKTYEKWCHLFTELHISLINDNTIGDTMTPDLKNLNPNCKVFTYYFEPNIPKPTE